ncbi:MAG: C25 family cysteine peptidase [Chitinophagales bacterium]|nr:T9SS type A sorting domain-containing protein [Bacteroidota bacterium]
MKKIILLGVILLLGSTAIFAADWQAISSQTPENPTKTVTNISKNGNCNISVNIPGFFLKAVTTPQGTQYVVEMPETTPLLKAASPDLPKLTVSNIVSDTQEMVLSVTHAEYQDFTNIEIAPSKGNFTRDILPANVPYTYGQVYNEDKFFPENIADLRSPYILRDFRGQTAVIYPFQYNPVQKVLRVYIQIDLQLEATDNLGQNPLYRSNDFTAFNQEFQAIYQRKFQNFEAQYRYTPVGEQGGMLIISAPEYMEAMEPFIAWKIRKGIAVEMIDVSPFDSAEAIKDYIDEYYHSHNLSYVLLVGDAEQVPPMYSNTANGYSDVMYGYLEGNDHYPEIFVGRFSANNITQVETQVQKVLDYEINVTENDMSFSKGAYIASNQGPGDDNEMDWEHARNMSEKMLGYTYDYAYEFYDGSHNGNDAAGDPTASMVVEALLSGIGAMLYTGHGSEQGCATSGLSSGNIENLDNAGRLPFFWSVACVNGDFVGKTCFAESWLRATHDGEPSGAIATLMSTVNQSWSPPMCGQDEMVDILIESYEENKVRSFAAISYNGCMKMNDEYGAGGDEMTDTWTCFGDPSFMVRTATPTPLTVNHNPSVFIGNDSFSLNCDTEGALAVLSMDGTIIATATVEGGVASFSFNPLNNIGQIDVTVTGFNTIPYLGEIDIIPAEGPYVGSKLESNMLNFGSEHSLSFNFENYGIETAEGLTAHLSSTDEFVAINNNDVTLDNLDAGATADYSELFNISIADNVPDQHVIHFELTITDANGEVWTSYMSLTVNAPVIEILDFWIDDSENGNDNGRLDPGETVQIYIESINSGHAPTLVNADSYLFMENATNQAIITSNATIDLGIMNTAEMMTSIYTLKIDNSFPIGGTLTFNNDLIAGAYDDHATWNLRVGLIVEDFESGDFTSFNWTSVSNATPWVIDNNQYYEGTNSSRSGVIPDNASSTLEIVREAMYDDEISFFKRVSSEQGWDFLYFYIDGQKVGEWSGEVDWSEETYPVSAGMHNYRWVYQKDNIYDDGEDAAWVDFVVLPPSPDEIIQCNAESGTLALVDVPEYYLTTETVSVAATDYAINNLQMYVLLDENQNIMNMNLSGTFALENVGTFYLAAVNYPTDVEVNNLQIGKNLTDIDAACFDIDYANVIEIEVFAHEVVGLEERTNADFRLMPNPASSDLYIILAENNNFGANAYCEIIDVQGRVLRHSTVSLINNAQLHFEVNDLMSGLYQIRFTDTETGNIWQQKWIKY